MCRFPCGLWQLFHVIAARSPDPDALTGPLPSGVVRESDAFNDKSNQCAQKSNVVDSHTANIILRAIVDLTVVRDFVLTFFSCLSCQHHFAKVGE